ncbi:MAG: PDZ domain-containing protein [Gammaproteobacteria bacterium]|nr:MAG: PDZ domain-containing protein [Gammaproteobacteria bacterium]
MKISGASRFVLKYFFIGVIIASVIAILKPDLLQLNSGRNSLVFDSSQTNNQNNYIDQNKQPETTPAITKPATQNRTCGRIVVSYADSVSKAAPAVVSIHTAKIIKERVTPVFKDPVLRHFFGRNLRSQTRKRIETSLGSGVVVDHNGYILTSYHVISDADEIQVVLNNGSAIKAEIAGVDQETDLAVLQVKAENLPVINIGNSDKLRIGDVVLAIGDPFGVGQTVTQGIVGATGRNSLGITTFENFIQTDAAINPGNSGGALINAYGDLVGINTAIYSKSGGSHGVGFSIPVNLAIKVKDSIVEKGYVVRGWLGIVPRKITPLMAEALGLSSDEGVFVEYILKKGPAYNAGIRQEDIILEIDGNKVDDARTAMDYLAGIEPGKEVTIRGMRRGRYYTAVATAIQRPITTPAK